jgi:LPS sulfotransferase NodH
MMINAIQFQPKRVGSTFLQKAIDSHPDIMGIDEVFVNMAKKKGMRKSGFKPFLRSGINDAETYIRKILYKTYPDKHTIFKLMYNQIDYHAGLFNFIKTNKIPMIHLMRKNLVKQIISGVTAATTKHNSISISPKELMESVKEADKQNIRFAKRLKDNIWLTLYYEDIIGEKGMDRTYVAHEVNVAICQMFNVKSYLLYAETKKKNKNDISVYLPNIEEIRKYFKGSEFEWMIQ